ncbi:MAG: Gfo/Idh/MocA family oxidoreductase [Deltaproteobacteria bacterium]|nr:Gfo/Idh/MocA family oxidoreductase [Deltaproteobacteria bacterium]
MTAALIGCGRIAQVHQQYLATVPEAELVAVCDADAGARAAMSARAAVPPYASLEQLLAAAAPQVVHILTPPPTHAPLALQALAAGAHVLIEKPMALSAADADSLVAAAHRNNCIVTADHNRWFDPVVQRARALLASGALGTLTGVEIFQGAVGEGDAAALGWKTALPGGPLHDVAPHPLYFLRHFLGPIATFEVMAERDANGNVAEARAIARGEAGWGTVTLSLRARPASNWVRLLGSVATAEINLNHMTLVVYRDHQVSKLIGKVLPNLDVAWQLVRDTARNGMEFVRGKQRFYPGIGAHLREFYRCVAGGLPAPVSAEAARDVVAMCEQTLAANGASQPARAVGL